MHIDHILAAVDFSEHAGQALRLASELALALKARLSVVHVQIPAQIRDRKAELNELATRWAVPELLEMQVHSLRPAPADVTLDWALRHQVGLVVCGSRDEQSAGRAMLGSFSSKLLGRSPIPVLVAKARPGPSLGRVLLASDAQAASKPAARLAVALAQKLQLPLSVLHVLPGLGVRSASDPTHDAAFLAKRQAALGALDSLLGEGAQAQKLIEAGEPVRRVLETVRGSDYGLVVTACHARQGMARTMMGSVTEELARQAPCSLLGVPIQG